MKPQEAIPILKRLQEPEAWEPQISRDAFEALELAIEALKKVEKIPYKKVEIIHCESCKHWTHTPLKGYGLGKCDFHDDDLVTRYGSCGSAERRNDE